MKCYCIMLYLITQAHFALRNAIFVWYNRRNRNADKAITNGP